MRQLWGAILLTAVISITSEAQTVRNVPANFATIQAAIVAAQSGDTVRVAPGVYVENINFLGKAITVVSVAGADVTTIDGGLVGTVVTMASGEGPNSVIDGFTIRNGKGPFTLGGGIEISGSPTIRHNHIVNNGTCAGAPGISIELGSPIIQGNFISNNASNLGCSGGSGGGGIYIGGSGSAQILDNTISNNSVQNSSADGGGISVEATGPTLIRGNIITGNYGAEGGGIRIVVGANVTIVQNLIAGNDGSNGGGIFWQNPGLLTSVTNNTIVDNTARLQGSAIYADGKDGTLPIKNNIIGGKSSLPSIYCGNFNDNNPPILAFNDVFADQASAYSGFCSDVTGTNGNISVVPLFVDRASQNYRLSAGSAGIDAGTNVVVGTPLDLDSFPRILPIGGPVDMGAYEFATATTSTTSPASLTFPDQSAGTISSSSDLTLTNTGTAPLVVGSVTVTGDFSQTNTCQTLVGILAGESCTISVRFAPTAGGSRSGQLTIASNSVSSNAVSLSGNGIGPLTLSGNLLAFIDQRIGTTSPATALGLSNTGATGLNISSITTVGDFTSTNDCTVPMAAGSTCTISIRFAPTARGIRFGAITINVGGSLNVVTLSGRGVTPLISFSPSTSISFGSQTIGSTSALQSVIVSNPGDLTLAINSITIPGPSDFNVTNNCGSTLGVNASCSISAVFSPTVAGPEGVPVTISDDAMGSPHIISVNGSGIGPLLTPTPTSLAFGNQALTITSPSRVLTLRNTGTLSVTISSIVTSGEFAKSGNCTTLFPNSSCTLQITFTPTAAGPRTGVLTVINSSLGSPLVVPLSGTGIETTVFSATSLSFSADLVGTTSPAKVVAVTNATTAPLTFSGIAASGDFPYTTNCGTILVAGSNCTISVSFSPTATGARSGSLGIGIVGVSPDQIVSLTGTGLSTLPAPVVTTISPDNRALAATGTTLTVNGSGFSSLSVVRWGGANRPTTLVNSNSVTATLFASDFAAMGTIPVAVFNPSPGGGLSNGAEFVVYVSKILTTKDLIYDRTGNQIYASVAATAPILANTLTPIDPVSGVLGTSISIGSDPGKLAISDDSRVIYVALDGAAQVRPFDVVSQTPGTAFGLGTDPSEGAKFAEDIAVAPGISQTIAVSRKYANVSPRAAGIAIYDNGVKRTVETAEFLDSTVIEFSASSPILYGFDNESSPAGFRTMSVGTSGVVITKVVSNLISPGSLDFQYQGGLVYSYAGQIIDPVSGTQVGTFTLPTGGQVRGLTADPTLKRVFILYATTSSVRILAYDLNTFVTTGSVTLPAQGATASIGSLIRWGDTGLAFRSGTQVFTLQIPQNWLPSPPATLTLAPATAQQGQNNLDVAVTGQFTSFVQGQTTANFGAGITVNSMTVADTTHATANITIASAADLGIRNVTVTTGGQIAGPFSAFTVTIGRVQLTDMFPLSGSPGTAFVATFAGNYFADPLSVNIAGDVSVSNLQIVGPNLAVATLTIANNAILGVRSVTLTNSAGTSVNVLNFTVTVNLPSLTMSKSGGGSGTVTSNPAAISCGVACSASLPFGQIIALTPTPSADSVFGGWSGDADCLDGSVTMTASRTCVARFDLPQANTTLLRGDYDGDGKTDIAVYRPSTGEWFLRLSTQNYAIAAGNWYFQWGIPGDIPINGDFDGDGKTDISVYRPSTGEWLIRLSTQGYAPASGNWYFQWGLTGDVPITGDFDGDGKTDISVYRPSTGEWLIRLSTQGYLIAVGNWYFQWGLTGDQPVAGDFDGDGKTDIAAYRPSTGEWFLRLSTQGYAVAAGNWYFQWGLPGDQPVAGDFDGDRKTDIAVFRPSSGEWYLRLSTQGYVVAAGNWYFQWAVPDDLPLKADFDGDGKADIAVFRPATGEWFLRLSTQGYVVGNGNWYFQWGVPGDLQLRR